MGEAPGHQPGGSVWLAQLLSEHGRAVEADLARYYGVPLADLVSGRLSSRRLMILVEHLPRESATVRSVHGQAAEWGHIEHLLADVIDLLRAIVWQNSGKGRQPEPIPRPGQVDAKASRSELTAAQRDARLLELQARERQRQGELQQQQTTTEEEVSHGS